MRNGYIKLRCTRGHAANSCQPFWRKWAFWIDFSGYGLRMLHQIEHHLCFDPTGS
jgi:hypothetical protein